MIIIAYTVEAASDHTSKNVSVGGVNSVALNRCQIPILTGLYKLASYEAIEKQYTCSQIDFKIW